MKRAGTRTGWSREKVTERRLLRRHPRDGETREIAWPSSRRCVASRQSGERSDNLRVPVEEKRVGDAPRRAEWRGAVRAKVLPEVALIA